MASAADTGSQLQEMEKTTIKKERVENMFPDIQNLSAERISGKINGGLSPGQVAIWYACSTVNRTLKDVAVSTLQKFFGTLQDKLILKIDEKRLLLECLQKDNDKTKALDKLCGFLQGKNDDDIHEFIQVLQQDTSLVQLGQFVHSVFTRCHEEALKNYTHPEKSYERTNWKMKTSMEVPPKYEDRLIKDISKDRNHFSEKILKSEAKVTCVKKSSIVMHFQCIDKWSLQDLQYDITSSLFTLRFVSWLQEIGLNIRRESITVQILDISEEADENKEEVGAEEMEQSHEPNMAEPYPFIFTHDGKMTITPDLDCILSNPRQLSVISIVGKYRTGKSYIMNRFFKSNAGFSLGPTIQASTKGIWLWARPHPLDPSRTLILLDTEGLHDVEKGDKTHDMKLFTLALLLSNCLIYNVTGALDDVIIQQLHLVTELTKYIKIKDDQEETGAQFSKFFPNFVLLLRDFFLEMKLDGKECTADEYLENALKVKSGRGSKFNEYNEPRLCIRDFFPHRKCFTMCKPVEDDEMLRKLDTVDEKCIKPEFLDQAKTAIDAVLGDAKGMSVEGTPINGRRFLELARCYVKWMNAGNVPCISNAAKLLKNTECQRALEGALQVFKSAMEKLLRDKLPVEQEAMIKTQMDAHNAAIAYYKTQATFDEGNEYIQKLMSQLEEEYQSFQTTNNHMSEDICEKVLDDVFKTFKVSASAANFLRPGGHKEYQKERELAVQTYNDRPNKGPMAKKMLSKYLGDLKDVEINIINADRAMSEKDKENAKAKEEILRQRDRARVAEEEKARAKEELLRQENEHRLLIRDILDAFKRERENLVQEYARIIEDKQKEYNRLISEGMHQQAEICKAFIEEIDKEREKREASYGMKIQEMTKYQQNTNEIIADKLAKKKGCELQ